MALPGRLRLFVFLRHGCLPLVLWFLGICLCASGPLGHLASWPLNFGPLLGTRIAEISLEHEPEGLLSFGFRASRFSVFVAWASWDLCRFALRLS